MNEFDRQDVSFKYSCYNRTILSKVDAGLTMYMDVIEKFKIFDADMRLELASSFSQKHSSRLKKLFSKPELSERATKFRPGYRQAVKEVSNEIKEYLELSEKTSFRLLEIRPNDSYLNDEVLKIIQNLNHQIEHVVAENLRSIKDDRFDFILGPISDFYSEDKIPSIEGIKTLLAKDGLVIFCEDFIQPYKNKQQRQLALIELHSMMIQEINNRINGLNSGSSDSYEQEGLELAASSEILSVIEGILENAKSKISLAELEDIASDFSLLEKKPLFPNDRLERGLYKIVLANKRLPKTPYFIKKLQEGYQTASDNQHFSQETTINMIAPSNMHPQEVLSASGGVFAEILAEGYRHERYHRGTSNYDDIENMGEIAARTLFDADYVNLKPHSGTQAVQAALLACKYEGRNRILSLSLKPGGHITHSRLTMFNKLIGFEIFHHGVDKSFELDYDAILEKAKEHKPEIIIAGYSAFPKTINFEKFREIADSVGARLIADVSHTAGLIAGGAYPNPTSVSDVVVFSTSKTLAGPKGGMIVARGGDNEFLGLVSKALNIGLQSEDHSPSVVAKAAMLTLALEPKFNQYSEQVVSNAKAFAAELHSIGVPVLGYDKKSKGTDSHIVMIDVHAMKDELNGHNAAKVLEMIGVLSNKNLIPDDKLGAHETSGVRFGTSAVALGGAKEDAMKELAAIIANTLKATKVIDNIIFLDPKVCQANRSSLEKLAKKYSRSIL